MKFNSIDDFFEYIQVQRALISHNTRRGPATFLLTNERIGRLFSFYFSPLLFRRHGIYIGKIQNLKIIINPYLKEDVVCVGRSSGTIEPGIKFILFSAHCGMCYSGFKPNKYIITVKFFLESVGEEANLFYRTLHFDKKNIDYLLKNIELNPNKNI